MKSSIPSQFLSSPSLPHVVVDLSSNLDGFINELFGESKFETDSDLTSDRKMEVERGGREKKRPRAEEEEEEGSESNP